MIFKDMLKSARCPENLRKVNSFDNLKADGDF